MNSVCGLLYIIIRVCKMRIKGIEVHIHRKVDLMYEFKYNNRNERQISYFFNTSLYNIFVLPGRYFFFFAFFACFVTHVANLLHCPHRVTFREKTQPLIRWAARLTLCLSCVGASAPNVDICQPPAWRKRVRFCNGQRFMSN